MLGEYRTCFIHLAHRQLVEVVTEVPLLAADHIELDATAVQREYTDTLSDDEVTERLLTRAAVRDVV